MKEIINRISLLGIIPVIAIEDANDAVPLAHSLINGGLPVAEITFRTQAAKDAIKNIATEFPEMILGAGTVLTIEQVSIATENGAKFIVSPGFNRKVVEYCINNDIPIAPGISTPSDIEAAIEAGLEVVKFFPAEQLGGLDYLKAMSAPYKDIKFIPTGGIDENNLTNYLKFPKVIACGGSWMVKSDMIQNKQFAQIQSLVSQSINSMLGFHLKHIGINNQDQNIALESANNLSKLINLPIKDGNSSVMVGTQFEFVKSIFKGDHGHIAIGTNFIERAINHLENFGFKTIPESKVEKNGKLIAIYLDLNISGFAIHLLQV